MVFERLAGLFLAIDLAKRTIDGFGEVMSPRLYGKCVPFWEHALSVWEVQLQALVPNDHTVGSASLKSRVKVSCTDQQLKAHPIYLGKVEELRWIIDNPCPIAPNSKPLLVNNFVGRQIHHLYVAACPAFALPNIRDGLDFTSSMERFINIHASVTGLQSINISYCHVSDDLDTFRATRIMTDAADMLRIGRPDSVGHPG
jgi:hypothetical protein